MKLGEVAAKLALEEVQKDIDDLWKFYEEGNDFTDEQTIKFGELYDRKVALKVYLRDYLQNEFDYKSVKY